MLVEARNEQKETYLQFKRWQLSFEPKLNQILRNRMGGEKDSDNISKSATQLQVSPASRFVYTLNEL